MKNKTKKIIAWTLILVPALAFLIYGIMTIGQGKLFYGLLTILLTIAWIIGDAMLALSKK